MIKLHMKNGEVFDMRGTDLDEMEILTKPLAGLFYKFVQVGNKAYIRLSDISVIEEVSESNDLEE